MKTPETLQIYCNCNYRYAVEITYSDGACIRRESHKTLEPAQQELTVLAAEYPAATVIDEIRQASDDARARARDGEALIAARKAARVENDKLFAEYEIAVAKFTVENNRLRTDIEQMLMPIVDAWHLAPYEGPRRDAVAMKLMRRVRSIAVSLAPADKKSNKIYIDALAANLRSWVGTLEGSELYI